ncbi:GlxA family transcriptional regulator [Lysobacter brunescens]|uniref:GlxA family transcriptional regulator n=1 Tax=Lysobacter brunescens TaxID=262323 RepID=A0ABW2Y9Y6_9GAMM
MPDALPELQLIVLPGAHAAGVAVSLDILRAAATLAPGLTLPAPRWRVLSPDGGDIELAGGLRCPTTPMAEADTEVGIPVVPGLATESPDALECRLAQPDARAVGDDLARRLARGLPVAATCSSVFLLRDSGALAGRSVTTTWWLAQHLRRTAPGCRVDADRIVCVDGALVTAGAAMAQVDLMLHLLRGHGAALADAVARVLLLDARTAQSAYTLPALLANGDALVRRLVQRIEETLPRPPAVSALAEAFAMSPRTLSRRVRDATGQGPSALIQAVRLSRARRLLETTRMSIDQVAAAVGYEDATALRRLVRRRTGATPTRFRAQAEPR